LPSRDHLRLVFIGDGADRDALRALAHSLDLESSIEWTGALDHASTLARLARAHLFVLASFAEGLPVALMEAMALGVPCISTFIAGIPELIHSGENGLLVPAGNVSALTAAMQRLLDDNALWLHFTTRARQTIADEYNLHRNLDPLADHLRDLCALSSGEFARHA
jgi:glycosyltransferase involved in cell wall biosynthesis